MKKLNLGITALVAFSLLVGAQGAQALSVRLNATGAVSTNASTTVRVDAKIQTRITTGKDRADKEIDRRITMMTDLENRLNSLKRLSVNEKSTLTATVQGQIAFMTTLKAKIVADTDIATLHTDIQSITKSYRIFALILPQVHLAITADAVDTTVVDMATLATKLQTRITADQNAGKDVHTEVALLTDFNAKSSDAKVQADAAVSAIIALQPDNGDKTIAQSNKTAFATAKTDIATAHTDLKTARDDATKIISGLKGFGDVEATTTTTVQ